MVDLWSYHRRNHSKESFQKLSYRRVSPGCDVNGTGSSSISLPDLRTAEGASEATGLIDLLQDKCEWKKDILDLTRELSQTSLISKRKALEISRLTRLFL